MDFTWPDLENWPVRNVKRPSMFSKFGVTPLLTTNGWTLLNHQILGGSRWQWNGHALLENGLTLNYTMNINESGDIFQPESHVFIPQISTTSNLTIWMAQGISSWFPIQISLLAGQWSGHPGPWVRRPKCQFSSKALASHQSPAPGLSSDSGTSGTGISEMGKSP